MFAPPCNKQENGVFYCVCIHTEIHTSIEPHDCIDDLNSVANHLDPCQNVKMQKLKNVYFGRGQVQFGAVNDALGRSWNNEGKG